MALNKASVLGCYIESQLYKYPYQSRISVSTIEKTWEESHAQGTLTVMAIGISCLYQQVLSGRPFASFSVADQLSYFSQCYQDATTSRNES